MNAYAGAAARLIMSSPGGVATQFRHLENAEIKAKLVSSSPYSSALGVYHPASTCPARRSLAANAATGADDRTEEDDDLPV